MIIPDKEVSPQGVVPHRFHCGVIPFAKNAAKSGLKLRSRKGSVNIIWHT